jgi:SdrD B-like domain/Domain of unknown function (DUF4214)
MDAFARFHFVRRKRQARRQAGRPVSACLRVETLEDRTLPSCTMISGYVFNDANDNGLLDPGETGIANSALQLFQMRNGVDVLVSTATTDATGFYQFSTDNTVNTSPTTLPAETFTLPLTATDFTAGASLPQFDPSLGTLLGVEITNAGQFVSDIKVESLDNAPSTITATDSGSLTLSGLGLSGLVTNSSTGKTFNASAFDGVIDFGGTSGHDFGPQTASGSNSFTITAAADLAAYIGTGSVTLTEIAHATSAATGAGNLITQINTQASAQVSIVYRYIPSNCLKAGSYTIVLASQPSGYLPGLESQNGAVLPHTVGANTIPVTLGATSSTNNDFGEIVPAAVSGSVYVDANGNGTFDSGEPGISGVALTLTGTNDLGNAVTLSTSTAANGSYAFTGLRPGTYAISETQPSGYLAGKDSVGTVNGIPDGSVAASTTPALTNIVLDPGNAGIHYDFGQLLPASLSGFVYLDSNNNGVKDPNESGIDGVTVTLTGTNDLGASVQQVQATGADGSYLFSNLRPGTYIVTETRPLDYLTGKTGIGTVNGVVDGSLASSTANRITSIALPAGQAGINYDFAERLPPGSTGVIYSQSYSSETVFQPPSLAILSKIQFLSSSNGQSVDPVIEAEATYVDGLYRTLLQRPADEAGLIGWVTAMQQGMSRAQVVAAIWDSAEHRGLEVDQLYQTFLHRQADAAGRAAFVNVLMSGATEEDVALMMIDSNEYQSAHPDNTSFILGLYADILGRTPAPAETAAWLAVLQGGTSRQAVAQAFLTSQEAYTIMLNCDYECFLHRSPDSAGEQMWLQLLLTGQDTPAMVTQAFLASNEFYAEAEAASQAS